MISRITRRPGPVLTAVLALALAACGGDEADPPGTTAAPAGGGSAVTAPAATGDGCGAGATKAGFIYVGSKDDFGYNQAAYEAAAAASAVAGVEALQLENIKETLDEAVPALENLISQGATVLFATSFGHFDAAVQVAKDHPDVCVVHQGQAEAALDAPLDNFGTYFSSVYEPVYLAGIAAGSVTETNILGFVYAIPIPQTIENINAFTLGAQSVNPDVKVLTVATTEWCDPTAQSTAAKSLIAQGADVLTQHQDCTKTIIETAEEAGVASVGYHYDASSLAPEGWLTGSEWDWADLYADIIKTAQSGEWVGSPYDTDFRVGYNDVDAPFLAFKPSPYGPKVDQATQDAIKAAYDSFFADADGDGLGDFSVFSGPLADRDGTERIPDGVTPSYTELDSYFITDGAWVVAGVEGSF